MFFLVMDTRVSYDKSLSELYLCLYLTTQGFPAGKVSFCEVEIKHGSVKWQSRMLKIKAFFFHSSKFEFVYNLV